MFKECEGDSGTRREEPKVFSDAVSRSLREKQEFPADLQEKLNDIVFKNSKTTARGRGSPS